MISGIFGMNRGLRNMAHTTHQKNVMLPCSNIQDISKATTTDKKKFVEYRIVGYDDIFRRGPYSDSEIEYHYNDIKSYDRIYDCRIVEV